MDNLATLLVAAVAILIVGLVVYRIASKSGRSTSSGFPIGTRDPNRDRDQR